VSEHSSRVVGTLTFWAIFLGAISLAATALGIDALTAFVGAVCAYLPNVIAALAIFLIAGALAAGVSALVARVMGDTGLGKVVATAAPILIMTIATFMILDQLRIAHNIVVITYAALLGARLARRSHSDSAGAPSPSARSKAPVRTRRRTSSSGSATQTRAGHAPARTRTSSATASTPARGRSPPSHLRQSESTRATARKTLKGLHNEGWPRRSNPVRLNPYVSRADGASGDCGLSAGVLAAGPVKAP
jgi:hypothetical protein